MIRLFVSDVFDFSKFSHDLIGYVIGYDVVMFDLRSTRRLAVLSGADGLGERGSRIRGTVII